MTNPAVPSTRISRISDAPVQGRGKFVLYWMVANRRARYNFALQRAVELAHEVKRPLVVLEPLRVGYRWASHRFHAFVIDGMRANAVAFGKAGVTYMPYVEPAAGEGKGLVRMLADDAAAIVTDDYPCFFHPRMLDAVRSYPVAVEAVDSNGLLPVRSAGRAFARAVDFRRFLQRELAEHLWQMPVADPIGDVRPGAAAIPKAVAKRWPAADLDVLDLARLPVPGDVGVVELQGGAAAAGRRLAAFLHEDFERYGTERNDPDRDSSSRLSPYLHFGHLSAHEVLRAIASREDWTPHDLGTQTRGGRQGWWNMSEHAESFLDELVTWRELGFNGCVFDGPHDVYESVPAWARKSLSEHQNDPRPHLHSMEELDEARTGDEIWNAAQRQLLREGRIHNYLRMLWGKKVLEWSATPAEAFARLVELNNRYALDGRDPNSYSGISWCFGRYDRAWGPERPIFGKIRYMSSDNTRRKLKLTKYLRRYASAAEPQGRSPEQLSL